MKNKLSQLSSGFYNVKTWRWTVLSLLVIFLISACFYSLNFFESSRPRFTISKKELEKNKINKNLTENDETESDATFEDFNVKYKELSKKIPKGEWKLTERELSPVEYEWAKSKYYEQQRRIEYLSGFGINASAFEIAYPSKIITFPYSMKGFMDNVYESLNIDSIDFDAKIEVFEKIEHFIKLTDKRGIDTILIDKFKSVLRNSKNLTLNELKEVEKLHRNVTKTKLVFSTSAPNSPEERQGELFKMYEAAANCDITENRFAQLNELTNHLKSKKIIDTVVVLNVLVSAMNTDLSWFKEKGESVDELEIQLINDFFMGGKINFNKNDVEDKFKNFKLLFTKKTEEANLEKKAREVLHAENRKIAVKWILVSLLFTFIAVIIVFLAKLNQKLNTNNTL